MFFFILLINLFYDKEQLAKYNMTGNNCDGPWQHLQQVEDPRGHPYFAGNIIAPQVTSSTGGGSQSISFLCRQHHCFTGNVIATSSIDEGFQGTSLPHR